MPTIPFVGASYTSQSVNVDDQAAINWYPEISGDQNSKVPIAQYPTPGTIRNTLLSGPSVRAIYEYAGRCFAVSGPNFYEIMANGTNVSRGTVAVDSNPASMCGSPGPSDGGTSILVVSAGVPYVFDMLLNTFTPVDPTTLSNVLQVLYSNSFCIALLKGKNQWQYSNSNDPTTWDDSNITAIEAFADNLVAMNQIYQVPYFFGPKQMVPYYASGNLFAFDVIQGGLAEVGCGAQWSTAVVPGENGSIFFLSQTPAGSRMFHRLNQFTPVRISNHAIEYAMSQYATVADAISYCYQDQGHWFYVTYFPTANVTWVYDVTTGLWHQRGFWVNGRYEAHHSQCYAFAFGKHLVGDWKSGNVYEMNINFLSDVDPTTNAAVPIVRERRAPHLSKDQARIAHRRLQIEFETGLGPQPPLLDGNNNPRAPQASLSWSDDGGHVWSDEYMRGCGQAGQYRNRVIWRRLGNPRDRVYRLRVSDPIPWRIVNAYLNSPDNE